MPKREAVEGDHHLGYVSFPSTKAAAAHIGCTSSAISQSVSKGKEVAGVVWRKKKEGDEENEQLSQEAMDALRGCKRVATVAVKATGVTGEEHQFPTLRAATDFLGVNYSGAAPRIRLAAVSGQGYRGYKWGLDDDR